MMKQIRQSEWKVKTGYTINATSGIAEKHPVNIFTNDIQNDCVLYYCTLYFHLANPGDVLHLLDDGYEYAVATYAPEVEAKYIYTYDYQPEESWTSYRGDFSEDRFTQEDYVFSEKVYFRVVLRRKTAEGEMVEEKTVGGKITEGKTTKSKTFKEKTDEEKITEEKAIETKKKFEGNLPGVPQDLPINLSQILYWQTKEQEKVCRRTLFDAEVKETVQAVQAMCKEQDNDTLNFIILSDTHYAVNGTWDDTMDNLRQVSESLREKGIQIDGIVHLGDATDGLLPAELTRHYVRAMQTDLSALGYPFYYVPGNHDSNYFRGNPERFSTEEMQELYLPGRERLYYDVVIPNVVKPNTAVSDEVKPSDVRSGVVVLEQPAENYDSTAAKDVCQSNADSDSVTHLRMIFLDSFDPKEQVRYGFHDEELDWLENLLAQTPPDCKVLVFSHVPPTARLHYWSNVIRGSRRLLRILREYQARTGSLLGLIHGHNHADQIDYEEGFPIISIGCNKCEYFEEKKPEGAVTYKRALHTVSQDLWDVCVVSPKMGTIDFVRFGAGEDRHIHTISHTHKLMKKDGETGAPMKKVITYGTFDLFHEGHYNLLKRAKELGDYLIVGVTTEHYDEQRGKLNIVDSLLERIENVRRTGLVDEIIIEDHEGQKIEDIQKYDVDIFTEGSDWRGIFDYLKAYCQVVYLERTPGISSTTLRKGKYPIIRMGIVGTGRIAPRFLSEAKFVSGINVQCVYNPHRESAEKFGAEYALESYSASFEEFLDAVDAIYIATPHETHYDYVRRALQAGKHVLCEKPMALTRKQAEELFALARERNRVLMEGIKTAYCPGFAQIINIAMSGRIGEIRDVEACFSRLTEPHLREMVDVRYGGAFMEFGSYTVLPILKLMGTNYESVEINSIPAENGVDLYTKIQFKYPQGFAMSKTGIGVKSEGQLLISGTKGYILAESPWWLTRKFQVRYEDPGQIETYTPKFVGDGLRYEIGDFVSQINGFGGHAFKLTEEESIVMADVVERFLKKRDEERKLFYEKNKAAGVKIWAHRGCSYQYPENTLAAFQAACELPGLTGIELDIQLSKDGEMVVFHDETVDRLMDATGRICDYTLAELQQMHFKDWVREKGASEGGSLKGFLDEPSEEPPEGLNEPLGDPSEEPSKELSKEVRIPSMEEVLELLRPYSQEKGLLINIELKNSRVPYEGMEEKILELVRKFDVEPFVIYSSFNGESVKKLKDLDPSVKTGILQSDIRDCLRLKADTAADALHPNVDGIGNAGNGNVGNDSVGNDGIRDDVQQQTPVRAWNSREPFYRQIKQYIIFDLCKLSAAGVTDFITNVPEEYL